MCNKHGSVHADGWSGRNAATSLAAHSSGKIMSVGGLPAFCAMCNRSQERVFEEIFDLVKDDCSDRF
jgi:hypothetical protein